MSSLHIVLRETIEFSVIVILLTGVFKEHKRILTVSAALTVLAGILITIRYYPLSGIEEKAYTGFMFYSFIMILFLSFASGWGMARPLIAIVLSLLLPAAQLAAVIAKESFLGGGVVFVYAIAGLLFGILTGILGDFFLQKADLRRFFRADSIMVFIAVFCFLFGGLNEFDNSSIITSLQHGSYIIISFLVAFIKNHVLIPQGKMMPSIVKSILDFFSSQRVALAFTALIFFLPPLYVFIKLLFTQEPFTGNIEKKAEKRKVTALYREGLISKGAPLLIALLVSIVMLHSANLSLKPVYDPEPVPVTVNADVITLKLADKHGDISNGKMRKFSIMNGDEEYRLMVIKRPDAEIVAMLDACEICPSYGYVQKDEYVICKYCSTPVPLHSLGQSGGCNPIPVAFKVEGNTLIVKRQDVINAYKKWTGKDTGHF